MNRPNETDRRLRNSILDILCYYSVYKTALTDQQILSLLNVRANMVGIRSHLTMLQKRGKIIQSKNGLYNLKKIKYTNQSANLKRQRMTISQLKKSIRIIKLLPFIKSIAITSDYLLDDQTNSLPKLIIICSPNRIYLTMTLLTLINKLLGGFSKNHQRPYINPLPMFFTTAGFSFVDQMGYDELSRVQWFGYCKPIYGELVWDVALRKNDFISNNLPNYTWKKQDTKYITSFSQLLDNYDNMKYRSWLRMMADNNDYKKDTALLRVRPDSFIAREYHFDQLKSLQSNFTTNRSVL
ncbi:MAG TPA: hypothetical protein PJ993_02125 [Candidatus Saccharibacteria bacterium]|nr:hypothetical protein [Candidatus Saccharibacteria bacterium]HMT39707.1 hypothetical protein [Candidatus Saccharibacteria bacterium]